MRYFRITYRLLLLAVHLSVGLIITATLLRHGETRSPNTKERGVIIWWQQRAVRILGLRIHLVGSPPEQPVLLVSNHISWLDIPVLGSLLPVSFVSKIEIRHWPLLGVLAGRSGTLFIERGGRNAANRAAEQIAFRLRRGDSIAVFPEGTTTEGHSVRRFHARLFGGATHAEADIQPAAIRYPHSNGVHPAAPFVGNAVLFSHGLRVLGEKRIDVEVTLCHRLASQQIDRRTLSEQAREAIRRVVEHRAELARTQSQA